MAYPPRANLLLFAGQSNMAGRGAAALAPAVPAGVAWEYRAVTQPHALVPLTEPFGQNEDNPDGVYEPGKKTGSLVSAFVNACYAVTRTPIVGVSCAKGGSGIDEWRPGGPYFADALDRCRRCAALLQEARIAAAGSYLVFLQGCTDGDNGMPAAEYRRKAAQFFDAFLAESGLRACFLIQIGNRRDDPLRYRGIRQAQAALAAADANVRLVSDSLKSFAALGLMKDTFHYTQEGYNRVGAEAGANAGREILRILAQDGPGGDRPLPGPPRGE